MAVMYRVKMIESERGWGRSYYHVDFDTFEKAKAYIVEVNQRNYEDYAKTRAVPDYYIQPETEEIEAVEVDN